MSGTILENLSNKKLSIVLSIILIIQLISFFIGAFIGKSSTKLLSVLSLKLYCVLCVGTAPAPSSTEQLLAVKCISDDPNKLSIPRAVSDSNLIRPQNCRIINDDPNPNPKTGQRFDIKANE